MLIDFEVTINDKDFAKLKRLSDEFSTPIGEMAISCMMDKVKEHLERIEYNNSLDNEELGTDGQSEKETEEGEESSEESNDPKPIDSNGVI